MALHPDQAALLFATVGALAWVMGTYMAAREDRPVKLQTMALAAVPMVLGFAAGGYILTRGD